MKSKIFKNNFSDLKVEVMDNGWITIYQDDVSVSVGIYPNARTRLILEAFKYSSDIEELK